MRPLWGMETPPAHSHRQRFKPCVLVYPGKEHSMPESLNPENPNPPAAPPASSEGHLSAVLPLRDIVVFPHMIVPLFVGREKSVRALEEVMTEEKQILLLTQKNAGEDDPSPEGLYRVGTL